MAGEAWRLELAPFGVRVVSVITGTVATRFFENVPEYKAPEGSLYAVTESDIRDIENHIGKTMPAGEFADDVVDSVIAGANGRIYKGNNSNLVRLVTALAPRFVLDRLFSRGRGFEKLGKSA